MRAPVVLGPYAQMSTNLVQSYAKDAFPAWEKTKNKQRTQ